MKKSRVFLVVVLIVMLMSFVSINNIYAHSIELDPDSLISFPWTIYNGKGKITISSSQSGYSLYYQAIKVSNSTYAQIEKINDDGKAELERIKTKKNELEAEYKNLKEVYDEAVEEYQNLLKNSDDAEKIAEAKEKAETALTNYKNKVEEHNLKVDEYNAKVTEINNKIKELTPSFVESKWVKTEDRSFNIDLSQFSGEQVFAVWAKLVSSNGKISYDQIFYTMSGTKPKEVKVTSVSLDKEEVTINQGSSYTLVATVNPENATDKTVTWKSSDEKIATVSNGKITAIAEGTATITVTTNDGKYTDTCKVTVKKKSSTNTEEKVTSVSLNKEKISLEKGNSYKLVATVDPENATDKTVTWKSSNEKVAKVSKGKVTAIAEGTATITVTTKDGSYTDTCKVTVTKKVVEENKEKEDNTIATGKIPQTGTFSYVFIFGIILISVIGFITYKKVKYLNFK